MSYNLDTFVNVTAKAGKLVEFVDSADLTDEDLFEVLPTAFGKAVEHDAVNEQAFPVFVYELKGNPVAFYDCELLRGYIV